MNETIRYELIEFGIDGFEVRCWTIPVAQRDAAIRLAPAIAKGTGLGAHELTRDQARELLHAMHRRPMLPAGHTWFIADTAD